MEIWARAGFDLRPPGGRFGGSLRARARSAKTPPGANAIARHLVLAYHPGWQSLGDLNAIANHVRDIDPTIGTFIVPHTHRNGVTRKAAAERPTLVVSPGSMGEFKPSRGKVFQGRPIPKIEEIARLRGAGLPVPRTELLTPDLQLDPGEWGEFVIVKPTDILTSSHGLGIQLMRTSRVRHIAPQDYPRGHPGRLGPMIVQQFIDTGDHISVCRVLTFFGEPLYAMVDRSRQPRVDLAAPDAEIESAVVATQAIARDERFLVDEADVLAMARAAHEAIPEIPLKGCDFVREAATGRLYVLELNCGGNTWHFSSRQQAADRRKQGPEFELKRGQQFDAMRTAARVLVDKTNAEAE
jgi:hypothetical protein